MLVITLPIIMLTTLITIPIINMIIEDAYGDAPPPL